MSTTECFRQRIYGGNIIFNGKRDTEKPFVCVSLVLAKSPFWKPIEIADISETKVLNLCLSLNQKNLANTPCETGEGRKRKYIKTHTVCPIVLKTILEL